MVQIRLLPSAVVNLTSLPGCPTHVVENLGAERAEIGVAVNVTTRLMKDANHPHDRPH